MEHQPEACLLMERIATYGQLEKESVLNTDLDVRIVACQYMKCIEIYYKWWNNARQC